MSKSQRVSNFLNSIAESAANQAQPPKDFFSLLFETAEQRERREFNARTAQIAGHVAKLFA